MQPFRIAGAGLLVGSLLVLSLRAGRAPADGADPIGEFVEPGFPFITSTVDARDLGPAASERNVTPRAVVLLLGDSTYAAWDPDLLRMAVGWRGDFMSLTTMAQVSYREAGNKQNDIPRVLGRPLFTNGIYPGWMGEAAEFRDPRAPGPNPDDVGRGPLPAEWGRWNGVYRVGDRAVLSYTVQGTDIHEQPGSVRAGDQVGIARIFQASRISQPLTLVVAEVPGARSAEARGDTVLVHHAAGSDSVTAVGVSRVPPGSRLEVAEGRYVVLRIPRGIPSSPFRVTVWRGPAARRGAMAEMMAAPVRMARFARGGPRHWPGVVQTQGQLAPDTAAYVVDRLPLPLPNPWKRNVRVADVAFFADGRAAVVTFDGDVWTVSGIEADLRKLRWKRFASGLYEPLGIEVVDDQIYVHGREGVVRLRDLNRDGEADFYENFSNLVIQSTESREFPLGFESRPGGGFYLARGGALNAGPKTAPAIMPGFRAGSWHAGSVLEISADGRTASVFASGLREPFIGVHPERGTVTASDQQGNFVPSTPIYVLQRGGYYGVPATAHLDSLPTPSPPLVWIPHTVDQSGASQVWVTGDRMGFNGDALIHLSYGRPGVFRVLVDSAAQGRQGAIVSMLDDFTAPLLNGEQNPRDGQLYLAGFQIWGSKAQEVSTLARLRYTGRPGTLPTAASAGQQGVLLRFDTPLDPASVADPARFQLQRWNYQRTEKYGSGHFRLDGSPGRETLPVGSAHLAPDGRWLLLVVPDMREAEQVEVAYDLRAADGRVVADTLHLTLNQVPELDLAAVGLGGVDWRGSIARAVASRPAAAAATASAEQGRAVFQRVGCVGCHSVDGSTAGKLGPTMRGLYLAPRQFEDGSSRRADEEYLRESILEPGKRIVQGFAEGMPSYQGVLSDAEVRSLVMYIQSLGQ